MAAFCAMKTSLMQTPSHSSFSPSAPRYLDLGVHKSSKGPLSPQVPSEPIMNTSTGPCAVTAGSQGGFAIRLGTPFPAAGMDGWMEPAGPSDTAEPMC